MYIIFDTETTGLPQNYNAPISDLDNWPRAVQIAWQLHESDGRLISANNLIIKPQGFSIPFNAVKVHGITTEKANAVGQDLREVVALFAVDVAKAKYLVGHNIEFDINVMGAEFLRSGFEMDLTLFSKLDTKEWGTDFCAIPGGKGGKFKWPTLGELYLKLFGKPMQEAHDAAYDVEATTRSFFAMLERKVIITEEGKWIEKYQYQVP
ncbi:MAG: 3'-5' exonuclease, partial [Bacteroidetes bacterium]|nr:3'-5' exonuclease [Bacteroidota bacterium]